MSTVHLLKKMMRSMRLTPMKLALTIGAMVAVVVVALVEHRPGEAFASTMAGEAQPAMVGMSISVPQQGWSDEWYEVQKSIPDNRIPDDVPTF